ncbi:ABC transporter permease [Companilactobacillus baiquanensis]|uniref:ABC transporter permease n=1 Tax=Companilactobacillus baiquanensis TaxID=2486005 RepID=A0ABW1UUE8_9LACO|nr:ABC transporter permease [Companilactobacillus baiquanensis]
MNKLWIVTFETFLRQIKSWSFVALILGPFIIFGISMGAGYVSYNGAESGSDIAVISKETAMREQFIKANKDDVNQKITTVSAAKKAVNKNKLAGYLVLKTNKNQATATYHGTSSIDSSLKTKVLTFTSQIQQQLNYAKAGMTLEQVQQLQQQPAFKEKISKKTGTAKTAKLISFWVTVIMVYTILVTYTGITAQEIASEKGTKIMEIIFSSTTASKYFIGKILGVLLVILTQILIYLIGGWGGYLIAQKASMTKDIMEQYHTLINSVLHNLLSVNLVFLLLGVVIYTILAAFSGALVTKAEDASKAAQPVTMLSMLAFFVTFPFQNNLDAVAVKILSYVPFFSSYFMPMRVINSEAGPVEISISLLILVLSIVLLTFYISKIYQGLMLQTDDSSFWKRFKRGLSYNK